MIVEIALYFILSAFVVFGLLIALWLISIIVKDASLIDIFWGFGFLTVAITCLCLKPVKSPYLILLAAMPIMWGLRLSLYLARRNLGILGGHGGEDKRYVAMRQRAAKKGMSEMVWRLRSLFAIYFGQGVLIMVISAPIWVAMATGSGWYPENHPTLAYEIYYTSTGLISFLGAFIWLIGFLFEAIGDWQLAAFMKFTKDYDGPYEDKPILDTGLWKYTRHPNYFGNACMWWGIWLVACQAPWGWTSIFAPIIMSFLLIKISGKDLLERNLKKRPAYRDYMTRTSGFLPKRPKQA